MTAETATTEEDKASLNLEWAELVGRIAGRTVSETGAAHVRALLPAESRAEARNRSVLAPTRSRCCATARQSRCPPSPIWRSCSPARPPCRRIRTRAAQSRAPARRRESAARIRRPASRGVSGARGTPRRRARRSTRCARRSPMPSTRRARCRPRLPGARPRAQASRELRRELSARLAESMNRYADVLRDKFYTEREGRFVLPVRADAHLRVEGIVSRVERIGRNAVRRAEGDHRRQQPRSRGRGGGGTRIARVLGALSISARTRIDELRVARNAATLSDVLMALARVRRIGGRERRRRRRRRGIRLVSMRHPLLIGAGTKSFRSICSWPPVTGWSSPDPTRAARPSR